MVKEYKIYLLSLLLSQLKLLCKILLFKANNNNAKIENLKLNFLMINPIFGTRIILTKTTLSRKDQEIFMNISDHFQIKT